MNLIIDQGNTRSKLALFENGQLRHKAVFADAAPGDIKKFIAGHAPARAIISTVSDEKLYENLRAAVPFPVYRLSVDMKFPIRIAYETPHSLGLDRLALAVAAACTYPAQDCLVIDAGTAITYDFVNRAGEYLGGGISPGLQMRYKALHHFTARLPLVQHDEAELIGRSTTASIRSGVGLGLRHEVSGIIAEYRQRYPQLITVLTGGDAIWFDESSKSHIFAAPEFLLQGLNHILEYHADKI